MGLAKRKATKLTWRWGDFSGNAQPVTRSTPAPTGQCACGFGRESRATTKNACATVGAAFFEVHHQQLPRRLPVQSPVAFPYPRSACQNEPVESPENLTPSILKLRGLVGFLIGENLSLNPIKPNIFNSLRKQRMTLITRNDLVHRQVLRGTFR